MAHLVWAPFPNVPFYSGKRGKLLEISYLSYYIRMCLWNTENSGLFYSEEDENYQQVKVLSKQRRKTFKTLTSEWCGPFILVHLCLFHFHQVALDCLLPWWGKKGLEYFLLMKCIGKSGFLWTNSHP